MLIGTLVHELLQESLKNGHRSQVEISQQLKTCLEQSGILKDLLSLNMDQDEIRKEVEPFLPHILFFIEKYVLSKTNVQIPPAAYASQNSRNNAKPQIWSGSVENIKDIEENIWSPRLGIKGKVDLTVQVKMQNKDKQGRTCKVLPLELKTGRPSGTVTFWYTYSLEAVIFFNLLVLNGIYQLDLYSYAYSTNIDFRL